MAKNVVVKPLTIIINQMIVTGIFPDQLKVSKVIPLYKAKDQTILSNYRPIALLPANKISFGERFNNVISRLQNVRF